MQVLKGKGSSPGFALAPAFILKNTNLQFSHEQIFDDIHESKRWKTAHSQVVQDLSELQKKYSQKGPQESAEIAEAHLMMAQDPEWISNIESFMGQKHQCEYSVNKASEDFAKMIESLDDPYLRQRAQDIRDVARRILRALDEPNSQEEKITGDHILVAEDLLPSELLSLYSPQLKGLVLQKGNPTSHTTILARTFEIPTILTVNGVMEKVRANDEIAVSGMSGIVTINPDASEKKNIQEKIQRDLFEKEELKNYISVKSVTRDGVAIEVASNLNSAHDLNFALGKGTEGIGLFRTEFLLMDRSAAPSEEEQYQVYRKVIESVFPHKAIIRTFDIGGDKQVNYLNLPKEENPFLGLRGIRYCLKNIPLFRTQIRALLRAAQHGNLGIMIPMVTKVEEVLEFKNLLKKFKIELLDEGKKLEKTPETGIMIEVPSVAMIVDQLASHLDFFSIGTNDLIQYLCAADRMNSNVADLHDAYHPAVLRTLKLISDGVKNTSCWLGICGEMAAKHDYQPLLLALGFKELSVSPGAVLRTRKQILSLDMESCRKTLQKALLADSSESLKAALF
ncbi:MAG: phosphoenolpyruvate--protein phosphotransferase [bacterium]